MTYGTSYFPSMAHACWYYKAQYGSFRAAGEAVQEKVRTGEIHIGKPPLQAGQTCFLIDNQTRWAIRDAGKPGRYAMKSGRAPR